MSHKRMILEESDEQLPSFTNAVNMHPQEYEMPTRGQSFTDGIKEGVWRNVAIGLIILLGFIALLIFG